MSNLQHCQDLFAALGRRVGIAELALDDDRALVMAFDALEIVFQYDEAIDLIVAYGAIGELPQRPGVNLLRAVMALNLQSLMTGPGAIGTDETSKKFIYVERIAPRGLTADSFVKAIEGLLQRFDIMKSAIAEPGFGAETDERFDGSAGSDQMMMMRL